MTISAFPDNDGILAAAIRQAGGVVGTPSDADALIWNGDDPGTLRALVAANPKLTWIQLCSAGIEKYLPLVDSAQRWTRAFDAFGPQVAEHALGMLLALQRRLDAYARRGTWHPPIPPGRSLFDARVMIVGAGSIAKNLIPLLVPFRASVCVVRRQRAALPGAAKTISLSAMHEYLPQMDAVVLALPLTRQTAHLIGTAELRVMRPSAVLVNVARGELIDTTALAQALNEGWIDGAGLDVTDPEPLPLNHQLWQSSRCLITPHVANPPDAERESLKRFIEQNVRRYLAGEIPLGTINLDAGY
jgi:phosphoglycerate dehydrogenase-like enzyme